MWWSEVLCGMFTAWEVDDTAARGGGGGGGVATVATAVAVH